MVVRLRPHVVADPQRVDDDDQVQPCPGRACQAHGWIFTFDGGAGLAAGTPAGWFFGAAYTPSADATAMITVAAVLCTPRVTATVAAAPTAAAANFQYCPILVMCPPSLLT